MPKPDASAVTTTSATVPPRCVRLSHSLARTIHAVRHNSGGLETAVGFERRQTVCLGHSPQPALKGIDASEYPALPEVPGTAEQLVLSSEMGKLADVLAPVAYAATDEQDNTRPSLTGVLIQSVDSVTTVAAADGFQLAANRLASPGASAGSWIVSNRALPQMLAHIKVNPEHARLYLTYDYAFCVAGGTTFHTRLIDGKFPDYEHVVPTDQPAATVTVEVDALRRHLDDAALVARSTAIWCMSPLGRVR